MAEELVPVGAGEGAAFGEEFGVQGFAPQKAVRWVADDRCHVVDGAEAELLEGGEHG